MERVRRFYAAHPRFVTALHVILAAVPVILAALLILGFIYVLTYEGAIIDDDFDLLARILIGSGVIGFFVGIPCWILSLLLYRFTQKVRYGWTDWLRMTLIRLNIIGGFLAVIEVLMIILILIED